MKRVYAWLARTTLLVAALCTSACASTYTFVSEPSGATVMHQGSGGAAVLGTTPFEFKKAGLPEDKPFVVSFELAGHEPLQVLVTPTDGAHTKVDASLKPGGLGGKDDPALKRARRIVMQVFKVQDLSAQKRYAEAFAELRDLETREPDLAEVYVLKGSLHVVLGEIKAARDAWRRALQLDEKLDNVRERLAKLKTDAPEAGEPTP